MVVGHEIERRRPPVVRQGRPLDAEDDGFRRREGDPRVVRVPYEPHRARFVRGPTQVPALPVERRIATERGHRRGRSRPDDDERRDRGSRSERPQRARPKDERDREPGDERSGAECDRTSSGQRRRPADAGHRDGGGCDRTSGSDEERDREREAEDGAQHERVHLGVPNRYERQEHAVEVDDAGPDVAEHRREDALVAERQQAPRAARRTRASSPRATPGRASARELSRTARVQVRSRARRTRARRGFCRGCSRLSHAAVTASARDDRCDERPSHARQLRSCARRARVRGRLAARTTAVGTPCAPRAAAGLALPASGERRSSRSRPRRPRRTDGRRRRGQRRRRPDRASAVTTVSSPAPASRECRASARARPQARRGRPRRGP